MALALRIAGRLLAVLVVLASLASVTFAQETASPALPDPLTPAAIEALVSRLSDKEVRDLLLSELGRKAQEEKTLPAATADKGEPIDMLAKWLGQSKTQVAIAIANSPERSMVLFSAVGDYARVLGSSGVALLLGAILAALVLGWALDRAYARSIASVEAERGVITSDAEQVPPVPGSVSVLARRFLRNIGGTLIAFVVAAVVLAVLLPERETRVALAVVIWMVFIPRLVLELMRFFLAPNRPDVRMVDLDDAKTRFLTRATVGITVFFGIGETLLRVASELHGPTVVQGSGFWFSTVTYALIVMVVIVARDGLRRLVQSGVGTMPRRESLVTWLYPTLAVIATVGTWGVGTIAWAMSGATTAHKASHLVGLILLLLAPMFDAMIRAGVRLVVPPPPGQGPVAEAAHAATIDGLVRVARVLVLGSLVLAIAALWNIPLAGYASAGIGEELAVQAIGALLILLTGYVLVELIGLLVNRRLARENGGTDTEVDPPDDEIGPTGGSALSRLGTVLPLIALTARIAVAVITVLMALSHLGMNVTALLAGAGVLGIAIGFGAQKLVEDVVSGVFFLIEDAFRTNEYINAGGIEGAVERISIRTLHLRQSDGALHCVPYSNISQITNLGRDWGTMKHVFTVPFDTSIDKVRKIFKKIGEDLAANPEFAEAFIQPFKFKGVSQVNDLGVVVRGKFMFKPELGKQSLISREIYGRVQADFAAAGIPFARREVHVVVGSGGADARDTSVAAGAAVAAAT